MNKVNLDCVWEDRQKLLMKMFSDEDLTDDESAKLEEIEKIVDKINARDSAQSVLEFLTEELAKAVEKYNSPKAITQACEKQTISESLVRAAVAQFKANTEGKGETE